MFRSSPCLAVRALPAWYATRVGRGRRAAAVECGCESFEKPVFSAFDPLECAMSCVSEQSLTWDVGTRLSGGYIEECEEDPMSAGKYTMSLTAAAQAAMLSRSEKASLTKFFADGVGQSGSNTQSVPSGEFVSRIGRKRVLWRRRPDQLPEVQMIVDESYAENGARARAAG